MICSSSGSSVLKFGHFLRIISSPSCYKSQVINYKGFKPPLNRDKQLEDYIACLCNTANSNATDKTVKSICRNQYKAIQTLRNDQSVIIKKKTPIKEGL